MWPHQVGLTSHLASEHCELHGSLVLLQSCTLKILEARPGSQSPISQCLDEGLEPRRHSVYGSHSAV